MNIHLHADSTSQIDLSQLSPVDVYFNDTLVWSQVLYGSVTQYMFIPQVIKW